MRYGHRPIAGIAALATALMAGGMAAAAAHEAAGELAEKLERRRTGRQTIKRGKHKPRRHGAKLRGNRLTVSKRVRRKHRRAA